MSSQITPDQPGVRIGATAKHAQHFEPAQGPQGFRQRLDAWLITHKASIADSFSRLIKQPIGSFFTCLVMAITLSLPTGLALLLEGISELGGSWQKAAQISLFLDLDITSQQTQQLLQDIQQLPSVTEALVINREQALTELKNLAGLGDALKELPSNPLPDSILVTPHALDKQALAQLVELLQNMPHVQLAQLDLEWVERLSAILSLGQHFIFGLALLLVLALLLIIGNTIRLHIENRRAEIEVINLVGGTDGYVRRPFLYMGAFYGLFGGVLAWLILRLGFSKLNQPVIELAQLYGSDFSFPGLGWTDAGLLVMLAIMLGYLGSWLAVARHLRDLRPQ